MPGPGATHDMKVQVVDFLPTLSPGIAQEPEPPLWVWVAPLLQGQAWRQGDDAPKQRRMLGPDLRQRGNMNFWDDQKMHRRPGVNVVEGEYVLVLMNFFAGDQAGHDLAKQAIGVVCHGVAMQVGVQCLARSSSSDLWCALRRAFSSSPLVSARRANSASTCAGLRP